MKVSIWVAVACLMLILTGMAKVGTALNDQKQPAAWGPKTEGCRLSVTADEQSYRFDQPIGLCLTLENVGDAAVRVVRTYVSRIYRFDVRLPDGKPAPLTLERKRQTEVFAGSLETRRLEPGQSDTDKVLMLNRLYDMTLRGEYTVTVYRHVIPLGDNAKPVEVASNTLRIIVHEKEATDPTPTTQRQGKPGVPQTTTRAAGETGKPSPR